MNNIDKLGDLGDKMSNISAKWFSPTYKTTLKR